MFRPIGKTVDAPNVVDRHGPLPHRTLPRCAGVRGVRRHGLTQRQLGELAGVAHTTVQRLESLSRGAYPQTVRKLALALLWERRAEFPDAVPVACVHDEIVVECDEDKAEKAEAWLEKAMIDGMNQVLNGSGVEGPRVPVEVETQIGKTWAG